MTAPDISEIDYYLQLNTITSKERQRLVKIRAKLLHREKLTQTDWNNWLAFIDQ